MKRLLFTTIIMLSVTSSVLAHDGSEHVTDLEVWVTGVGIILILLACIYSLWWKRPKANSETEDDRDSFF